jgi:hypothetical protein
MLEMNPPLVSGLQGGGGRGALSLGRLLGLRQPSLSGDRGRPMLVGGLLCEFASFALSLKFRGQRTQAGQLALRLGELGSERGELKAVGLLGLRARPEASALQLGSRDQADAVALDGADGAAIHPLAH